MPRNRGPVQFRDERLRTVSWGLPFKIVIGTPQFTRPCVLRSRHPCSEEDGSKVSYRVCRTSGSVLKRVPVSVASLGGDPVTGRLETLVSVTSFRDDQEHLGTPIQVGVLGS